MTDDIKCSLDGVQLGFGNEGNLVVSDNVASLGGIMLNKISQKQKDECCVVSVMARKSKTPAGSRVVAASSCWWWREPEVLLKGCRIS